MQEHPLSALDGRSTARLRRSACVWQTNIPAAHAARAMSGYDKRCESSKGRLLPVMWAVRIRLHPSVPAEVRASRREKGLGQALARAINKLLMPSMRQFRVQAFRFILSVAAAGRSESAQSEVRSTGLIAHMTKVPGILMVDTLADAGP